VDQQPLDQALRLQYKAALTAYKDCRRALIEASMSGMPPSVELVEAEAKAAALLAEARANLLRQRPKRSSARPADNKP
jgi:hypothetical protein